MDRNREYFSYSQLNLWETSRKSFYKRYGLGINYPATKYQQLGKDFMSGLEFNEYKSSIQKKVSMLVPVNSVIELPIYMPILVGDTVVELMGIIDSIDDGLTEILEYKTGKHPWTQEAVDNNDQILFYSYLVFRQTGRIPKSKLIHVETKDEDDGSVTFTGDYTVFHRKDITNSELDSLEERIRNAIVEIEEFEYAEEGISETESKRYFELTEQKKRIDEELDVLKSNILLRLSESGTDYGNSDYGTFSVASRTTYSYSKDIADLKKKVKQSEKEEQKNGVATPKTSNYLLFKPKKV